MTQLLFSLPLLFIGSTELLLIGGIALLLFGGKKLPEMMRGLGKVFESSRKVSMTLKKTMTPQMKTSKKRSQKKIHQKMN